MDTAKGRRYRKWRMALRIRLPVLVGSLLRIVIVSVGACACTPAPRPAPQPVALRVSTNRGAPVAGAEILAGDTVVGRSDAQGAVKVDIGGREGDSFELEVRCPPPLRSPEAKIVIRKLTIAGGDPEHAVKCEETRRTLVVVVRAENGPNLPILHLGKEIGRTDRSGAAHIKLETDIHDRVELTLSTAGEELAHVHPQNPVAAFEPGDTDDVREFAVTFTKDAKRKPPKVVPKGPVPF